MDIPGALAKLAHAQANLGALRVYLPALARAELGVGLEPLSGPGFDEGLHFAYTPGTPGRPVLHLSRMLVNWRISEWDGQWNYHRFWCFLGTGDDTFLQAARQLQVWQGDPGSEPRGFVKSWDHRSDHPLLG